MKKMNMSCIVATAFSLACWGFLSAGSCDASAVFTASGTNAANSNNPVAAKAEFTVSGNTLSLVLTNTNTTAIASYNPKDALCAVFFDVTGLPTLTYTAASGTTLNPNDSTTANVDLKSISQWGFAFNSTTGLGGATSPVVTQQYGAGTAGLGIVPGFDPLAGGQQFGYGIMDNGFTGSNGNNPLNNATMVRNSVTLSFTFAGTLLESAFKNVRFQYGTALSEGNLVGIPPEPIIDVPEPSSLLIVGFSVVGMMVNSFRRRRQQVA